MSELRDVDARPSPGARPATGPLVLFLGGLGTTRTGFDPQLAALADGYRCVAWDMPGYGAVAAARGTAAHLCAPGRRRRGVHRCAGRHGGARRRPLDGRPGRAPHGTAPSRPRALARAARLEPGVRARRHRSRGLEAPAPRCARCGRDAREHRRARAALDHGARRRRGRGRRRRRVDGAHLGRRPARRDRVPAVARRARRLGEIGRPRSCSSASTTRRRRSPTPRRSPPASRARGCRSSRAPATSRISRRPRR